MGDWSKPTIDSLHLDVLGEHKSNSEDAVTLLDSRRPDASNIPRYAKRWNDAADKFEYWNGTQWVDLATVYGITVSSAQKATNATNATNATRAQDAERLAGKPPSAYLEKTGGNMVGALGVSAGRAGGIQFPVNAFGGKGDSASITLENPQGSEHQTLTIATGNEAQDIVDVKTLSDTGLKHNNNTVWDSGNDGSQSGLDADMLDGLHASSFSRPGHRHTDVNEVSRAGSADRWSAARTLTLSGAVSGSTVMDGSENRTITTAIAANAIAATHIADNAIGASEIAANVIGESELAAKAVHRGNLATAPQSVSYSGSSGSKIFVAVGGRFYLGCPDVWKGDDNTFSTAAVSYVEATHRSTVINEIRISYSASGGYPGMQNNIRGVANGKCEYIQASPPYDLGDGEVPLFVFVLVDNSSGEVISISSSPEAPWHHNGPTNIIADYYDKSGKGYQLKKIVTPEIERLKGKERLDAILELKHTPTEVTQEIKQKDMSLIPHTFMSEDLSEKTVVLLDPVCTLTQQLYEYHNEGQNVNSLIHDGYLRFGNKSMGRCCSPGVLDVSVKWKNTIRS